QAAKDDMLFAFRSSRGVVQGQGLGAVLPRGPAETLGARVDRFFRAAGPGALVAGALPFARDAEDYLVQAREVLRAVPAMAGHGRVATKWRISHEPDAAGYAASVRHALDIMA